MHATKIGDDERRRSAKSHTAGYENMMIWEMSGEPCDTHFKINGVGFCVFSEGQSRKEDVGGWGNLDIEGCPEYGGNKCWRRLGIGLLSYIELVVNITDHARYLVGIGWEQLED